MSYPKLLMQKDVQNSNGTTSFRIVASECDVEGVHFHIQKSEYTDVMGAPEWVDIDPSDLTDFEDFRWAIGWFLDKTPIEKTSNF